MEPKTTLNTSMYLIKNNYFYIMMRELDNTTNATKTRQFLICTPKTIIHRPAWYKEKGTLSFCKVTDDA